MFIDFKYPSKSEKAELVKVLHDCGFFENAEPIKLIDCSTEIPLDGSYVMEERIVNEGMSFYPKGIRKLGGACYLRLVGDGGISPNFWGMAADVNSCSYRVQAGVVNCVYIWFDGTQVFYRITCASDMGTPAASVASAAVDFNVANKAVITFDHPLSQLPIPEAACFTVNYNGLVLPVTSVTVDDDTTTNLILMLNGEIDYADTCHISYTESVTNPLTDMEGFSIAAFSGIAAQRPD